MVFYFSPCCIAVLAFVMMLTPLGSSFVCAWHQAGNQGLFFSGIADLLIFAGHIISSIIGQYELERMRSDILSGDRELSIISDLQGYQAKGIQNVHPFFIEHDLIRQEDVVWQE